MTKKPFPLIVQEVVMAIEEMDHGLAEFLLHEAGYREKSDTPLLVMLKDAFNYFRKNGDIGLEAYQGKCDICYKGDVGFTFVGDTSGDFFSLIFIVNNGTIEDISTCNNLNYQDSGIAPTLDTHIDLTRIPSNELDNLLTVLNIPTSVDPDDSHI